MSGPNDLLKKLVFTKMMLLFNVNRINITRLDSERIEAIVGWPNEGQPHYDEAEEVQEVAWDFRDDIPSLDVSLALEVIALPSMLRGDRIEVPSEVLKAELIRVYAWDDKRAQQAIDGLLSIRIDMIDDGRPTDAFFLHF